MTIAIWGAFLALILGLLALDLGLFHRRQRAISVREALAWTGFWIALALAFNLLVYLLYEHRPFHLAPEFFHDLSGTEAGLQFFTGYVVEKSLSIDNIFVIAMIFAYFGVPLELQHRVLYWGILGALVLRGVMIAAGAVLVASFGWMSYVFGALLLVTAVKLLIARHDNLKPEKNPLVRLVRRSHPVSERFDGSRFFSRMSGRRAVTPLFLALVVIATSDVLFAVDSIPAIFAITRDPFIVFSSNVFAILGLRSLYFAVAAIIERFRYLKMSLVFVLAFIGVKMLMAHHYPLATPVSLGMIAGILGVGGVASLLGGDRDTAPLASPIAAELDELSRVTVRQSRRIVILLVGSTVLLAGLAMLVLPGPAFLVIPAGLGILGVEFAWARRWLGRVRRLGAQARRAAGLSDATGTAGSDDPRPGGDPQATGGAR